MGAGESAPAASYTGKTRFRSSYAQRIKLSRRLYRTRAVSISMELDWRFRTKLMMIQIVFSNCK